MVLFICTYFVMQTVHILQLDSAVTDSLPKEENMKGTLLLGGLGKGG